MNNLPKLRFPEFWDAGEWEEKKLGEIAALITEKTGNKKYTLMSINAGVGLVSQIEKFGREIAGNSYKNYFVIRENDFAYNKSATKDYPEGFIAMHSSMELAAVPNSIFTCFRTQENKVYPQYLNYLFLCNLHGKWLKQFISVGARAHGSLNIDNKYLLLLPIPLPKGESSLSEQQKIADCLSSIDDRITLETKKLDTLKAHKKGLMQQLFPAEGETLPKLRFPEFQDSGEWEEKKLGDLGEFKNGINFSADKKGNGTLTVDVLNMYGSSIETKLDSLYRVDVDAKDSLLQDGDILFVRSSMKREGIGWASLFRDFSEPVLFCGFLIRLRLKSLESSDPRFLLYYLRSDFGRNKIICISGTAAITNISQDSLKTIPVPIPPLAEQQKIADCLTSIDEAIAAQSQAIELLKLHKKGLMQQIFPSVEEVIG
jgi:type I restriction enzyme S subunit